MGEGSKGGARMARSCYPRAKGQESWFLSQLYELMDPVELRTVLQSEF